jgi:uncharacterized RmlC-like cupin family protein
MTASDRPVVTRRGDEQGDTAQSGGLSLVPHHHGEAETGAYLLSGRARIYFGEGFQEYLEIAAGDFMFVPPYLPHLEANMSTTEELWWLVCRSPENIVVNLPDVADASLAGYRRT